MFSEKSNTHQGKITSKILLYYLVFIATWHTFDNRKIGKIEKYAPCGSSKAFLKNEIPTIKIVEAMPVGFIVGVISSASNGQAAVSLDY